MVIEEGLLKKLSERLEDGENAALAIVTEVGGTTPGNPGIMMAVFEDGKTVGTVGGGRIELETIEKALECIKTGESKSFKFELEDKTKETGMFCGGRSTIFIRTFKRKSRLIIVGAGHVSYELYRVAITQNFNIHIVDSREGLCNKERFAYAEELHMGDVVESLRKITIDEDTYIVIAGPNHDSDEKSLELVLGSGAKYIGMLGSKNKMEKIREHITERGGSAEELDKVFTPIGIDMGSNLPSELAVGILAEIIRVKNMAMAKKGQIHSKNESVF